MLDHLQMARGLSTVLAVILSIGCCFFCEGFCAMFLSHGADNDNSLDIVYYFRFDGGNRKKFIDADNLKK